MKGNGSLTMSGTSMPLGEMVRVAGICLAIAVLVLMTGCNAGNSASGAQDAPSNYASSEFNTPEAGSVENISENTVALGQWSFDVDSKTEWDYRNFQDDLILRITAENGSGSAASVDDEFDITGYQNGEKLDLAHARDYKSEEFVDPQAVKDDVASSETLEYDWGWELSDYSPVTVVFRHRDTGKEQSVELVPSTSSTKSLQSSKPLSPDELEKKSLVTGAMMYKLNLLKPQGWYIDCVRVDDATLLNEQDLSKSVCVESHANMENTKAFMEKYRTESPVPKEGEEPGAAAQEQFPVEKVGELDWTWTTDGNGNVVASTDAKLPAGDTTSYRVYTNASFDEVRPVLESFKPVDK